MITTISAVCDWIYDFMLLQSHLIYYITLILDNNFIYYNIIYFIGVSL